MQRTLKREFKELEIVKRETIEVSYSTAVGEIQLAPHGYREASVRRVSELGVRCVFRLSCAERVHFSSALSEPASVSLFVSPPLLVGGAVERAAKSQRGSKYPLSPKGVGTPARICAVRETEALKRAPSRVSVPGPTSGIEGERKGELGSGGCRAFRGVKPPRCAASLGTARSCLLSVSRLLRVRFFQTARSGRWCIEKSLNRPVLKHGPRSLTCVRVFWSSETRARNESDSTLGWEALLGGFGLFFERSTTGRSRIPRRPLTGCDGEWGNRARAHPLGPERW